MDEYPCPVCGNLLEVRPDPETGTPAFFCPACEARDRKLLEQKAKFLAHLLLHPPKWPLYDPRSWLAYTRYWHQLQDLAWDVLALFKD